MELTRKSDRLLMFIIGGLLIFGLVMITSIGVPKSIQLSAPNVMYPSCDDPNVDCYLLFKKHLWKLGLGIIAFFLAAKISYRFWRKISIAVFAIFVLLLIIVLIFGSTYGTFSRSWLNFAFGSFQPTEFAKFAMILYLAHWLEKKQLELKTFKYGFLPFLTVLGFIIIPILLQPDIGSICIIIGIASIMYFCAETKIKHLAIGFIAAVLIGLILVVTIPHIKQRFITFLGLENSVECREAACWQTEQSIIAVGSGGFFGKGLTQGVQKSYWLPQASDDFIFAASAEELGFIRIFLVVLAYAAIAYRGFKIAMNAPDSFAKLAAVGITAWITIQAYLNIAVNIGLFPVTGITLPFVSYGGSSLISMLLGAGILINISSYSGQYAHHIYGWRHSRPHPAKYSNYKRA